MTAQTGLFQTCSINHMVGFLMMWLIYSLSHNCITVMLCSMVKLSGGWLSGRRCDLVQTVHRKAADQTHVLINYLSRVLIQTMWFPNRSDTNQAVQAQKTARGWKFGLRKKRNCTIPVTKIKALISFSVIAKLICAFVFA